jgi:hypothetical protein
MAPRRRTQQPESQPSVWKIRLPSDVAKRVRDKASALEMPQNRVIINELAAYPRLEQTDKLAEQVRDLEVLLARYSARISGLDISENLLTAVDAILKADGAAALESAVERLRVARHGVAALAEQASRKPKTGA